MGQYICSARKFVHGYELIGTLVILTSLFINPWNYFVNALVLILCAVSLYFYIAIVIADRNWLDIRAVFTAVWLATLGLAALRLLGYQEQWRNMTWCLCAVGYLMFQIGANLGLCVGKKCMPHIKNIKRKWFGTEFQFQPDRLFVICIVTTLIGMACFITNVAIKGFIPCFSNEPSAYVDFYTKFHVFATAATAICGCCYYCIKTQKLSVAKKFILWFCIFYNLILFPTLVVSRGVFVVAAIAFITVVFYLNKRKFWVVFICFAFVGGMYMLMSNLRSLADWQLDVIFNPNTITVGQAQESMATTARAETVVADVTEVVATEVTETVATEVVEVVTTEIPVEEATELENEKNSVLSFTLSPKLSFLYGYLTVSHDNFNEAVKYLEGYTWGVRQLAPINVILRQQWITDIIEQGEYYQVNVHLNTTNMLGVFYYDLHEIGVVIFMLLWSCLFGLIQSIHQENNGPFSLMLLGYVMAPVALSFFSVWINSFDLWMLCGTVLIFMFFSSVHLKKYKT